MTGNHISAVERGDTESGARCARCLRCAKGKLCPIWVPLAEASPVDILTVDRPGDIIAGKYRLEHVLGQGGMGTVWRAQNLALDSPVAIKVLSAALDASQLRERLLIEARAAAKLVHPNVWRHVCG